MEKTIRKYKISKKGEKRWKKRQKTLPWKHRHTVAMATEEVEVGIIGKGQPIPF